MNEVETLELKVAELERQVEILVSMQGGLGDALGYLKVILCKFPQLRETVFNAMRNALELVIKQIEDGLECD